MNIEEILLKAIEEWRLNRGVGTALLPAPFNDKLIILWLLQRIFNSSKDNKVLIIVNKYKDREDIINYLTNQNEENDEEFKELIECKHLDVLTKDLVNDPFYSRRNTKLYKVLITYRIDNFILNVEEQFKKIKFKLAIINKLINDSNERNKLYHYCPLLKTFTSVNLNELRLSTPVEEYRIPVTINPLDEKYKLLNYYTEYITTSLNIFGSFTIMDQARAGNKVLNISANAICLQIAQENGWHENLNMDSEFNIQIDSLYNPANLRERAAKTYEIIRERGNLLASYRDKLTPILDIIEHNKDKNILIINKQGEFASFVTDSINSHFDKNICANYHDKVEPIPAVTASGYPVFYKSGAHKGERKMMAGKAQMTLNETLFNQGCINVLSTTKAPCKELNVKLDIIIITSSLCESIRNYMYRLNNISFGDNGLTLYSIYCKNTQEEKLLENKELAYNHTIVNNCEKTVISEENSDIIVVD